MTQDLGQTSYPLTPLQQGMIYHSLLEPSSGVYLQQQVGCLRERIDVDLFRRAWEQVVARHDALRTRFDLTAREPSQCFEPGAGIEWKAEDWSGLGSEEQDKRWRQALDDDRQRGWDLSGSCPIRVAVYTLAEDEHRFLWTYHHALLDGRSGWIVLQSLFALYEALKSERELPPESIPSYPDFLRWLAREDKAGSKEYWQRALEGFVAPVPLSVGSIPEDPLSPGHERGAQEAFLTEEETQELRSIADAWGVTLGTLFTGSWACLLSRYSRETDVVFGVIRACRHGGVSGMERRVGLLINTVPFRVNVDPDAKVLDWFKRLRAQWVEMRPHERTSLSDIQHWCGFGPDKGLFETLLMFEDQDPYEALRNESPAWQQRTFQLLERGHAPLAGAGYGGSRLRLRLGYSRSRFDDDTISRMLRHWQVLLQGLVRHDPGKLADLPLLTETEREMILVEWNRTEREFPKTLCLHQLFEEQVTKTPDRTAVLFQDERLTYQELNVRANRLAHHLKSLGVGPEVRVALCLSRTPELIVSVLAILKAGGAYVPLDPGRPKEGLAVMIEESEASILVAEAGLLDRLPQHVLRTVCVDRDRSDVQRQLDQNPQSEVEPSHLAYAIYTSGTTGRPKLVGIEHRSVVNTIWCTTHEVLSPEDLAVAPFGDSICFDPSVYRIFCPLSVGGSILILESILSLPYSPHADSIRYVGSVPSVLRTLFQSFVLPSSVRVVTMGAETPSGALLALLSTYQQLDRVLSFYGPTEATIYCSYAKLMEPGKGDAVCPPINLIGKPIWNVKMVILDSHLNPVPVGVAGELHIGGVCLARGYLNDASLTRDRFIEDPFSAGQRLYKTGDLARYRSDGNIEFLGRMDRQVKIRGYRVEPAEIESFLIQHPSVSEAVVSSVDAGGSLQGLAAHVTLRSGSQVDVSGLRQFLRDKLPGYMVPGSITILDTFPLTSNGKIDRKALSQSLSERPHQIETILPRDDVEGRLVALWEEILGVSPIGITDNFFDLGGHSLLAVNLVVRIRENLGTELPLAAIIQAPTIEALRQRLFSGPQEAERSVRVCLQPQGHLPAFFCCHGGGGEVMEFRELALCLGTDRPFYGLRMHGWQGDEPYDATVEAMAQRYVDAVREVQPAGPYLLGGYCAGALVAFEMARRLTAQGERVAFLALLEGPGPGALHPWLLKGMVGHWDEMKRLAWPDRVDYVKRLLFRDWTRIRHRYLGYSVARMPEGVKKIHFMDVCRIAQKHYIPGAYAGRAVLFRSEDVRRMKDMGWKKVLPQGLEICDVPGTHLTLLFLPAVESLAREIQSRIRAILDSDLRMT